MPRDYDNTNSGALFRNEDKQSDKHPDYRGSINVDGVDYWLSAWMKTSKKGERFMSLAVKPKDQRQAARHSPGNIKSDIPFIQLGRFISGHASR